MKNFAALFALGLLAAVTASPAAARDSFVVDNAHLLSSATVSAINAKVADFSATTHKEVFVDTEPTVDGGTPQAAAEKIFAAQQINGVLIYVAKSPKTIGVVPDRAASQFFPATSTSAIRGAIVSAFNSGDYNGGITSGVDLTLSQYRGHLGALRQKAAYAPVGSGEVRSSQAGFSMNWIWILIVLAVIFFVIRGIFRAMAGPRMPGGYGGGGPMMGGGGPMMGGGYGPGYGGGGYGGGGGGSFWSGLMGGLGGAFLGNELFGGGRRDDFGGNQAGFGGGDGGQSQVDNSGFQSDPGQADMSNASFGGWGGGGDSGGGGGDWGGGGGDMGGGGGGGDSGGGW